MRDRYPALGHVLGAYFHGDADGGPPGALEQYVEDGARGAAEAAAEIDDLLATVPDEELPRCSRLLGNSWEVERWGMNHRQFFERLRETLREHAR